MNDGKRIWMAVLLVCMMTFTFFAVAGAEQAASSRLLEEYETTDMPYRGFHIPKISDKRFKAIDTPEGLSQTTTDEVTKDKLTVTYLLYTNEDFKENREDALAFYQTINSGVTTDQTGILEIQDHPAQYTIIVKNEHTVVGILDYVRNQHLLKIKVVSHNAKISPRRITPEDLIKLAEKISYDENEAGIKQSDGTLHIAAKEESDVLTAGRKKEFAVSFDNAEIQRDKKLNRVEWFVYDAETGEAAEGLKINGKGVLTAEKAIGQVMRVKVVASSPVFHTRDEYELTVMPAVKKITADPSKVFLYVGSDKEVTVQAALEPDTLPLDGITWTMKKQGVAEMTPGEDGTASFRALNAGIMQVTLQAPGGKSAAVTVNVVEPVTALTLKARGVAEPGKTVTVIASPEPVKAGNKAVEWSLDVDESIAAVNAKGQVAITKAAQTGTVIKVTCKALGAPEPVVATLEITVE